MKKINRVGALIKIPIMIQLGYYLEFEKFDKLESVCKRRLEKDDKDYIALYFKMYGYTKQKNFDLARQYFLLMLEREQEITYIHVTYKTKKYYIVNVIAEVIKGKQYKEAIKDCNMLLEEENSLELKMILKRMLCESNYYLRNFDVVASLCEELNNEFGDNSEIPKFTKAYMEAIGMEREK